MYNRRGDDYLNLLFPHAENACALESLGVNISPVRLFLRAFTFTPWSGTRTTTNTDGQYRCRITFFFFLLKPRLYYNIITAASLSICAAVVVGL